MIKYRRGLLGLTQATLSEKSGVATNQLAFMVWGPPQEAMIIESPVLAAAFRRQFLFIWERAKKPYAKSKPKRKLKRKAR